MLCNKLSREQCSKLYLEVLSARDVVSMQQLCKEDLFFLLTTAFKRRDVNKDWLYERCREVEASPDGYLDLWAREHYKSTIITYAKSIQDILVNPEITIGIFSHTRPIAKGFLGQIKRELESNTFLQSLFPGILYKEPKSKAPKWSLDDGIIVKRKTNPKESTAEAWGLVDGQPTSKHFSLLVYDDVIDVKAVTTPDQIKKATTAWELSLNLGAKGGARRHIGTRYHTNDTYRTIIDRGSAVPRIHPATHDGTMEGKSVFLTNKELADKRRDLGPYTFSAQLLQNPTADKAMGFKEEWLKFYDVLRNCHDWNYYILVDPASEKKTNSDYTVINVIGLGTDNNYYLVDGVRDRLNLTERTNRVFELHRKWKPLNTGYEKYGMQCDIEHMEYVMGRENYRFKITAVGGAMSKEDRIRRLVPVFEQGRFWLPHKMHFVDHERTTKDYIRDFIENEFSAFPVAVHDDMLDCKARILDPVLDARFPEVKDHVVSATMNTEPDKVKTDYDLFS